MKCYQTGIPSPLVPVHSQTVKHILKIIFSEIMVILFFVSGNSLTSRSFQQYYSRSINHGRNTSIQASKFTVSQVYSFNSMPRNPHICMSMFYVSTRPDILSSFHPHIHTSTCPNVRTSVRPDVRMSACPCIRASSRLQIRTPACPQIRASTL